MYREMATFLICTTLSTSLTADWPGERSSRPYPNVEIGPEFNDGGDLLLPQDFRRWIFIGSPVTPSALNGGAAAFPEFHNVYVEPAVYDYYLSQGTWPEGTMLVKELQLTKPGASKDGSREEASGRGYFPGPANGLDVSVKDSRRFPDTNGWGFFTFGHHAPPYQRTATESSVASCAGCHITSAHHDMVFSDFYEQLRPGVGIGASTPHPSKLPEQE